MTEFEQKIEDVREKLAARYDLARRAVTVAQGKINEGEAVGQEPSRHAAEEKARCQGMQSATKQSLSLFEEVFPDPTKAPTVPATTEKSDAGTASQA